MERPEVLKSSTHRFKVACGTLYISISVDDNGNPFEVFLNGGKSGGCRAAQESTGRLTSALLRNGLLQEAYTQLKGIQCVACSRWKGGAPQEERKNLPNSCGDTVARVLEIFIKKEEKK